MSAFEFGFSEADFIRLLRMLHVATARSSAARHQPQAGELHVKRGPKSPRRLRPRIVGQVEDFHILESGGLLFEHPILRTTAVGWICQNAPSLAPVSPLRELAARRLLAAREGFADGTKSKA